MGDLILKDGYSRVEGALMRGSNTITELYPALSRILAKYESVNDSNFAQLQPLDKNTAALLHRANGDLTRTINNIKNEWETIKYPDGAFFIEDSRKSSHCELCGQQGLRYIYRIRNKGTKIILKVGSNCIGTYDISLDNLTGDELKQKLKDIKSTEHMSKRNHEMNQKTDRGRERFDAANSKWKALPYLPPYWLTQEIQKCQERLQDKLKRFRTSKEDMSDEEAEIFKKTVMELEKAIEKAEIIAKTTKESWPVSQKVYQWALVDDKKLENRNRNPLATALEKAGRIDSTTVQRIMEEDHIRKCIEQLQKSSLCVQFKIEDRLSDTLKVKIHVIAERKTYPFSISYKSLISEAAQLGFPDKDYSGLQIKMGELLHKWRIPFDLNGSDIQDAWSLVNEMCGLAGVKIEDRNDDDTKTFLRVGNNQGTIIDTSLLIIPVSNFLFNPNKKTCTDVLRSSISKQELSPFEIARINWNEFYK